ncbi:Hsp20/alpha crystallin family protein [Bacilliculturomica massiliensis]|uniref:Hsp20/alpha crystallin family protein n=1 Tax=Bacilliculturomica massiliensis TaxID=1917867 RepID=UPI00103273AE|nr:Hsp20/alpha crystallin family protein [Bacilliculturomica massiliensis]
MFDLMPFRKNENSIFSYLDDLEKNFFGDLSRDVSQFRTDVLDKGDHYELKADLPGFSKEEIKIDLNGDMMTIRAEHREDKEEKKENYVRRERRYGSFVRNFDLNGIDKESISAAYQDGVLSLKLPKEAPQQPTAKQITVE